MSQLKCHITISLDGFAASGACGGAPRCRITRAGSRSSVPEARSESPSSL